MDIQEVGGACPAHPPSPPPLIVACQHMNHIYDVLVVPGSFL